jgi:hypothetical protein
VNRQKDKEKRQREGREKTEEKSSPLLVSLLPQVINFSQKVSSDFCSFFLKLGRLPLSRLANVMMGPW